MIIASLILSAAAVFLGLFINPPQGGGGTVNNLLVMSFLLPSPPYSPLNPPPKAIFDVDAEIFGARKNYAHHNPMTCNITQDPMPQCYLKPPPASRSSNRLRINAKFATPILSLPSLPSLSPLFRHIGNIAWISIALFLLWLACTQLRSLVKKQKAIERPLTPTAEPGDQWHEIDLHVRLFCALQTTLSEHEKALAEIENVTMQATEQSDKAMKREFEMEQRMKMLKKTTEELKRLGKEKEEETERMKEETKRQLKAWEKKEIDWTEKKKGQERRHKEDKDGLKMGRERERESWKRQVEKLKTKEREEKEKMEVKIKKILREKEQKREIWAKEKNGWEKEKEGEMRKQKQLEVEREARMKSLEMRRVTEEDSWEKKNHLAQERIVSLEEENAKLKHAAMGRVKMEEEQEAGKLISEGEREQEKNVWKEEIAEAKKLTSKLEEDLLSGRKLIGDLQTDKRIDRQSLLELRAQLMRPTHDTIPRPPTHFGSLRFGETAYEAAPNYPLPSAPSTVSKLQSPESTLLSSTSSPKIAHAILSSTTISSWDAGRPEVDSPIINCSAPASRH
ncbi:hypothetical protein MMC31_008190 [Peltigera leucophlebia]|nr:hypothetical protein [Peltigera leucophlebia]